MDILNISPTNSIVMALRAMKMVMVGDMLRIFEGVNQFLEGVNQFLEGVIQLVIGVLKLVNQFGEYMLAKWMLVEGHLELAKLVEEYIEE